MEPRAAVVVAKALRTASSCPEHPKYQALRYPVSGCHHCLAIWNHTRGNTPEAHPIHPDVLVAQRLEAEAERRRQTGQTAMEILAGVKEKGQ